MPGRIYSPPFIIMIISQFEPVDCPELKQVIKGMILDRGLKRISSHTQKPHLSAVPDPKYPAARQFERVRRVDVRPEVIKVIKNREHEKRMKMEMKAQEKYNRWLLNYLHKTSLLEFERGQHPLSMLATIEESDYPGTYQEGSERKEYPHCSNIIKLTDFPHEKPLQRIFMAKPQKFSQWQRQQNIFRNTSVRLKTVIGFIYKFMKSQSDNFDEIAEELLISIRNTKLLFDLFSTCFKLERQYEKLQRFRVKEKMYMFKEQYITVCRNFKQRIEDMFKDKRPSSQLIPRNLVFVNLKELHEMILQSEY